MLMRLTAIISNFIHWLFKPLPKVDEFKLPLKRLNRFVQAYYNRFIRRHAEKSVLYQIAEKTGEGGKVYGGLVNVVPKKGCTNNDPLDQESPQKAMKIRPWPQGKVLQVIKMQALQAMEVLDVVTAQNIKSEGEPIVYRRTMTKEHLVDAFVNQSGIPFTDIQHFDKKDTPYMYFVCFTTNDRLDYIRKTDEWEPRVEYAAYVDRPRYETEAGRVMISDGVYVVFVVIGENVGEVKQSIMIGADTKIAVTPLKDNLRVVLTDIPTTGKPVEGTAIHWRMNFAAELVGGRCAVLVARKRCK